MSEQEWATIKVSVRIIADNIDCDQVEKLLEIKPTTFTKRGSKRVPTFPGARADFWVFVIGKADVSETESLLETCTRFLNRKAAELSFIVNTLHYVAEVHLSYHSNLAQGGFILNHLFVAEVARSSLQLRTSILMWGDVSREGLASSEKHTATS
jgi:hypothetical protein